MQEPEQFQQVTSYASELSQLALLEARLAKQSLKTIVFCWLFSGIVVISTWFSILSLLGYGFWILFQNLFIALILVVISNMLMLMLIKQVNRWLKRSLFFPHTRRYLSMEE